MRRFLQLIICCLPFANVPSSLKAQDTPAASTAVANSNNQIRDMLERTLEKHQLPAMWAGKFYVDDRSAIAAAGIRKWGSTTPVVASDTVHIGSCTKAMTGLLIAQLVTDGSLKFDSTLREIFPDVAGLADSAWGTVTVNELLQHRSGVPANADWNGIAKQHANDEQAGRRATLEWLVKTRRPKKPNYAYSNVGFVLLGHIVEKIRGESWEVIIRKQLFEPLKIESAGFGPVGSVQSEKDPQPAFAFGHTVTSDLSAIVTGLFGGKTKLSFSPTRIDNPALMNPAGRVHLQVADWSRFVLLFADKSAPTELGVSDEVWQTLLKPDFNGNYAGGWVAQKPNWAQSNTLWHNGSNTTWYCLTYAVPDQRCCMIAVANAYCSQAEAACEEVIASLSKIEL